MLQEQFYEKGEVLRGLVPFNSAQFLIVPFQKFRSLANTMAVLGGGCILFSHPSDCYLDDSPLCFQ